MQKAAPALFAIIVALLCAAVYFLDADSSTGSSADRAIRDRQRSGGGADSPPRSPTEGAAATRSGRRAPLASTESDPRARQGSANSPRRAETSAGATGIDDLFRPLPEPGAGHWRSVFKEPLQSFERFVASRWNRPDGPRNRIYVLPLGYSHRRSFPDLALIERFVSAYFMVPAAVLPADGLSNKGFTFRKNPYTGNPQVKTRDILFNLYERLPPDAFGLVALTTHDLYPEESWNYVFGEAMLSSRVGVFSLARFDPAFYGNKRREPRAKQREQTVRRSLKIVGHEIGHMFGILHCVSYRCAMNGSNSLQELDGQPIHLCPLCLRKLEHAVGFDPLERYRKLLEVYESAGLKKERHWVERRLASLQW